MTVRIGINPITWSNDDLPELGGETLLETCLAETRQAGYAGIELGNKFPRSADALRPILDRHGLALVSGWYGGSLLARSLADEIAAIEDHLALLAALGCNVLIFAETTGSVAGSRGTALSRRPRLAEGDWTDFAAKLTALAEHAARRGVALAYHHHMGTVIESAAEIDRLMAATGNSVGLLLDTGHLAYADADPLAVARRHTARINHVHCKDIRREVLDRVRARDSGFLDAVLDGVFTVPGDGAIDYAPIFAVLKQADYRGWLVVEAEQDPAKAHPLTYARKGFDYLSRTAATARL
ncbi:MAG TPA: myo-inosose-2 dehydratase [Stellaceae bacterium]|jgi:inosose dehydratase|nr:myo-inosose-2 dehydratase [Stellaceae bacterium]